MNQDQVLHLLDEHQFEMLQRSLTEANAVDVTQLLQELPWEKAVVAFRLLHKNQAVQVFEQLDGYQQHQLLLAFTTEGARELLEAMSPDDRVALLDEVPATVARHLLQLLSPQERTTTLTLLGYQEKTAGRVMTPDFVDLREGMTVAQAVERIRSLAVDRETIYYSYVIDSERHLHGAISLRELMLASPEMQVATIMKSNPRAVSTHDHQEEVVRVLKAYDLLAVPVVDAENRMVGIVTWDDVIDIMEQEATRDIYRYGAVPVAEQRYFASGLLHVVWQRAAWLLVLILVNTVTASFIASQSDFLEQLVILAAFVPVLIGTGGNVGAQSSTVVIRGLATGEIAARRAAMIVTREIGVGALLGLALGSVALALAYLPSQDMDIAIVVAITIPVISTVAAMVGAALPFLFRALKVDPALVSAPLITTLMDISGVVLYFTIAHLLIQR